LEACLEKRRYTATERQFTNPKPRKLQNPTEPEKMIIRTTTKMLCPYRGRGGGGDPGGGGGGGGDPPEGHSETSCPSQIIN